LFSHHGNTNPATRPRPPRRSSAIHSPDVHDVDVHDQGDEEHELDSIGKTSRVDPRDEELAAEREAGEASVS